MVTDPTRSRRGFVTIGRVGITRAGLGAAGVPNGDSKDPDRSRRRTGRVTNVGAYGDSRGLAGGDNCHQTEKEKVASLPLPIQAFI